MIIDRWCDCLFVTKTLWYFLNGSIFYLPEINYVASSATKLVCIEGICRDRVYFLKTLWSMGDNYSQLNINNWESKCRHFLFIILNFVLNSANYKALETWNYWQYSVLEISLNYSYCLQCMIVPNMNIRQERTLSRSNTIFVN